jgi:hypothetical protein
MRNDDVSARATEVRSTLGVLGVLVVLIGVVGLGAAAFGVIERVAVAVWLGLLCLAAAWLLHTIYLATGHAHARVHQVADGVEVQLGWHFPAACALFATFLEGFFLWGAWTVDETPPRVALVALAALVLAVVPDAVAAAVKTTRVLLTSTAVTYLGWSTAASVQWTDVVEVSLDQRLATRPAVLIRAVPGAPSYRWRRRRLLLPIEPRPGAGELVVPGIALDEPWNLLAFAEQLAKLPEPERTPFLTSVGVPFLTGQMTHT